MSTLAQGKDSASPSTVLPSFPFPEVKNTICLILTSLGFALFVVQMKKLRYNSGKAKEPTWHCPLQFLISKTLLFKVDSSDPFHHRMVSKSSMTTTPLGSYWLRNGCVSMSWPMGHEGNGLWASEEYLFAPKKETQKETAPNSSSGRCLVCVQQTKLPQTSCSPLWFMPAHGGGRTERITEKRRHPGVCQTSGDCYMIK